MSKQKLMEIDQDATYVYIKCPQCGFVWKTHKKTLLEKIHKILGYIA